MDEFSKLQESITRMTWHDVSKVRLCTFLNCFVEVVCCDGYHAGVLTKLECFGHEKYNCLTLVLGDEGCPHCCYFVNLFNFKKGGREVYIRKLFVE